MIRDTLEKLEATLRQATTLKEENRAELLELLARLKAETDDLEKIDAEQAHSIAGFVALSTHEATRAEPDPKLLELSLNGLSHSVARFEETHPQLVQVANSICNALSNLGI
jgi:hypothetical protein